MDDDDDDCFSSRGIPEICLAEEDGEIFGGIRQPADIMIQTIGIGNSNSPPTALHGDSGTNGVAGSGGGVSNTNGNVNATRLPIDGINATSNIALNLGNMGSHSRKAQNLNHNHYNYNNKNRINGIGINMGIGVGVNTNPNLSMNSVNSDCSSTNRPQHHNQQHHTQPSLNYLNMNGSASDHLSQLLSNTNVGNESNKDDYLLTLAIEERKRKIDLLNAQIDYWKTLTKKLEANSGHNPSPSCLCHFPKMNGMQHQS